MAKSIKLAAYVNVETFNKVMFVVTEQTATGAGFGSCGNNKFRASNGIILASNRRPARDTDDKNVIWLRGSDATKNDATVVVGKTLWPKVVQAINEYNTYFADRAAPAPRPAPNCAVIIG